MVAAVSSRLILGMLILMAWSHDLSAQIGESDADDYFEFLRKQEDRDKKLKKVLGNS